MIPFAVYAAMTAAETPNTFQWIPQPPKLPFREDFDLHLIHGSLGHTSQPLKRHLDQLSVFAQLTLVQHTHSHAQDRDRQTHRSRYNICRCISKTQ